MLPLVQPELATVWAFCCLEEKAGSYWLTYTFVLLRRLPTHWTLFVCRYIPMSSFMEFPVRLFTCSAICFLYGLNVVILRPVAAA